MTNYDGRKQIVDPSMNTPPDRYLISRRIPRTNQNTATTSAYREPGAERLDAHGNSHNYYEDQRYQQTAEQQHRGYYHYYPGQAIGSFEVSPASHQEPYHTMLSSDRNTSQFETHNRDQPFLAFEGYPPAYHTLPLNELPHPGYPHLYPLNYGAIELQEMKSSQNADADRFNMLKSLNTQGVSHPSSSSHIASSISNQGTSAGATCAPGERETHSSFPQLLDQQRDTVDKTRNFPQTSSTSESHDALVSLNTGPIQATADGCNSKSRYSAEENLFILRARDGPEKIPWGVMPEVVSKWYAVSRGRNKRNMQVHFSQNVNPRVSSVKHLDERMQEALEAIIKQKLQVLYKGVVDEMEKVDSAGRRLPLEAVERYTKMWLRDSKRRLELSLQDAAKLTDAMHDAKQRRQRSRVAKRGSRFL